MARFPQRASDDGAGSGIHPKQRPLATSKGGDHFLAELMVAIVEDDPDLLDLVSDELRDLGAAVQGHSTVLGFLDGVTQSQPDVVISDIDLGSGVSGLALPGLLTKHFPDRAPPVLIAYTSFTGSEIRERCETAGFDAYLTKPAPYGELVALFLEHLRAKRGARSAGATT